MLSTCLSQERGLDTVDANRALGLPDDSREYSSVANILADMGVKSVRLMVRQPLHCTILFRPAVMVADKLIRFPQKCRGIHAPQQQPCWCSERLACDLCSVHGSALPLVGRSWQQAAVPD
jgi:hypothetical protein